MQVDNLNELSKEKRPPDYMIWDGDADVIEEWLDRVFSTKGKDTEIVISDVEG